MFNTIRNILAVFGGLFVFVCIGTAMDYWIEQYKLNKEALRRLFERVDELEAAMGKK